MEIYSSKLNKILWKIGRGDIGLNNIDNSKLNIENSYKIGSDWIFDSESNIGYYVAREKKLFGKTHIKEFIKVFNITEHGESKYYTDCKIEVPAGVVRKAREIVTLKRENRLNIRNK